MSGVATEAATVPEQRNHLRTFYVLTVTQVLSLIGSAMSHVAIGIRVFDDTGNTTPLLLASFCAAVPMMLGGSVAGVFVDRWNRRRVLIATDAMQAAGTLLLMLSFLSGRFQLWHLYAVAVAQGTLSMLQRPAMEASVTMLVPQGHRDRANAIRQITGPAASIVAPVLTGFAYTLIDVTGVMLVDLATAASAVVVVSLVAIPQPRQTAEGKAGQGVFWKELWSGLQFVWSRRMLFVLMIYAAFLNFLLSGPMSLTTPYLLTLTGSKATLGVLLGIMNLGIVVGGIAMMIWGGTRPRIHGIMLGLMFRALWLAIYGLVRTPPMLALALFFIYFANPLVDASFMSILQLKVPPDMQGRVFALLYQMMYIANPLSLLVTGPLVDRMLEPAVGSATWHVVAPLVGEQPGSGMGLLLFLAGAAILIMTALVYAMPKTRRVEADLPDYAAR
jgi:MFS family permease